MCVWAIYQELIKSNKWSFTREAFSYFLNINDFNKHAVTLLRGAVV